MKNIILKILKIIYWILIGICAVIISIGLTAMLDLATQEGGAPGYDPEAIFIFWLIATLVSTLILTILVYLNPIANFFHRQYLSWRYKKVTFN